MSVFQNSLESISAENPASAEVKDVFVFPMSYAQQRLWFLDQINRGSTYLLPSAVRLRGELSVKAVQKSLNEIVRRHEALRTRFRLRNGEPVQEVLPEYEAELQFVDLSNEPSEQREEMAIRLVKEQAERGFDLAQLPLMRVYLLRLAGQDHVLMVNLHHIISDGWSMGVLMREFMLLYEAYSQQRVSPLPALELQYADYAVWQREWLEGGLLEKQLNYWRNQLAGVSVLELPTDYPRPLELSFRGAGVPVHVPKKELERLLELCRQEGITLFMLLLASFQLVLALWARQDEIAVGTPIANRPRPELEGLIGLFVNTLVIRTSVGGNPSVREFLRRVREACLGAYAHQDLPVERLVEDLNPERSLNRAPLFQAMFTLQNTPVEEFSMAGLEVEQLTLERNAEKFDLDLLLQEDETGISGELAYSVDLFERVTMERIAGHWLRILRNFVANPEAKICGLDFLSEQEEEHLLGDLNQTAREYPRDKSLQELFEEQVRLRPNEPAVIFGQTNLSYAELNRKANQLARHLRDLGVGPDVRVGICMERTPGFVIAMLGVLKAGGAYVPLDPIHPSDRLIYMLGDAVALALVTEYGLRDRFADYPVQTICLDTEWDQIAAQNDDDLEAINASTNLAYVIYTSGSSGRPKGVGVTHRSVLNLIYEFQNRAPLAPGSRYSIWTSSSFDVSVYEYFSALLFGGILHIPPEEVRLEAGQFVDWLAAQGIHGAYVPPFMVSTLAERAVQNKYGLRRLLVGVEPIPESLLQAVADCCPELHIINGYGPTETTVCSTLYSLLTNASAAKSQMVPVGRPLANTQIYLLDQFMKLVPKGVLGELYIGGDGLAVGYLNQPAMTAERFVPNPFSVQSGGRLYRTGDLARWRSDGNLEFCGRIDDQVKIRGHRIEPGEIEAVLQEHPAVRHAIVMTQKDEAAGKRLVAYVVPETCFSNTELREHVMAKLPTYMAPDFYVQLKELPVTPNGKLDRKALPVPGRSCEQQEYAPPKTLVEEVLVNIWIRLLNLERVSVDRNFFELGGHSLLATQMISRIREAFGVEIPLWTLFDKGTIHALGEVIEAERKQKSIKEPLALEIVSREEPLPLSFAQQRLWAIDQIFPGTTAYNVPLAVRISGPLDRTSLKHTLCEIVARHEVLRTVFPMRDGRPVQEIAPALDLRIVEIDLRDLPDAEREGEAQRLAQAESEQGFDLSAGPLLRVKLVQLQEEEHVLLITMHHIVSDAWSMGIVMREFSQLYEAYSRGEESPLAKPKLQYADYAVWQRRWLQGDVLEEQLGYWRNQLAGMEILELATDHPRGAAVGHRGAQVDVSLGMELTHKLEALSKQAGATPFMVLLAAFNVLLFRYSGQRDISVGTPIANRNRSDIEGMVGFFVNTLLLRTKLLPHLTFSEFLKQVRDMTLAAYEHQDLPFERLVEELQPQRNLSRTPLFQIFFAMQNTPLPEVDLNGLRLGYLKREPEASFDLTMAITQTATGLVSSLVYNVDLFEAGTIRRMANHWLNLTKALIENPDRHIGELTFLDASEQEQILSYSNVCSRQYSREKGIHQLFEEQVEQTAEAVALEYEGKQLTYAELNQQANQFAHYMRRLGVGPETLVGLCLERSFEMVVGIIAILKVGGVYVPLDPRYPEDRLQYMLQDAGVSLVLTTQELAGRLQNWPGRLLKMDTARAEIERESVDNLSNLTCGQNAAYVIYTSGSTGRPKGVVVGHSNVVRLFDATEPWFEFSQDDVWTLFHSYAFDFSVWELWGALLYGGRLVIVPYWISRSPSEFYELVKSSGVTILNQTPSAFQQLSRAAAQAGSSADEGSLKLRRVIFGGESLDFSGLEEWFKQHGDEKPLLINMYGITETTVHVTYYPVQIQESSTGWGSRIGQPIPDLRAFVLDSEMQLAPIGVAGELFVGGAGVARGYLNRPELTALRFVPNPYSSELGSRLYRTGDQARWLPNGTLEFLGRLDHQVKIRGFRIELGEIEAVLCQAAGVRECVVVVREEESGEKKLVAYLVMHPDSVIDPNQLRNHIQQNLPEYMIPASFVILDNLPLTPQGKVDRRALPAPQSMGIHAAADFVAPRTPVEETLAAIWAEILEVERVGVYDNFFELGGHSLSMIQLASRLKSAFQVEVPLRVLFDAPTLAEMTAAIAAAQVAQADEQEVSQMLGDLQQLSPEELELILQKESTPDNSLATNSGT